MSPDEIQRIIEGHRVWIDRVREQGRYQLEAGVAAHHVVAESYAETDWAEIVRLYDDLLAIDNSPVVALNRAIALSRRSGPRAGLEALAAIEHAPALLRYHLLPATLGRLWLQVGDLGRAQGYYRAALQCPCSEPERRLLERRLAEVSGYRPV